MAPQNYVLSRDPARLAVFAQHGFVNGLAAQKAALHHSELFPLIVETLSSVAAP